MAKKFVREGIKLDGRNDILTLTDYFSVLLYYRVLKDPERKNTELPSIITKNDFSEIPEEVADEIDEILDEILKEFDTSGKQQDPMIAVLSGEINMFGFIMHDPALKQALGNVATEAIYRDERITEEQAYEKAKEIVPDLYDDFEGFLNDIASMSLKQISKKAMTHGVSISDMREKMSPKVAEIDWGGIRLHFDQPFSSTIKDKSKDKSTDDTMFG